MLITHSRQSVVRLMLAFALAVTTLACSNQNQRRVSESSDLIAQAYKHSRVLELRIPRAAYGPLRRQRGSSSASSLDQPLSLLEAEATLGRLLENSPNDSTIRLLMGRAALVRNDPEDAITNLQRALESNVGSPAILTDLASAYFERGEANHDLRDYALAFELQSDGLDKNDPMALFNRAITAERLFLLRQSQEDWEHYLRLDPSSEWSNEAREHLAEVESMLDAHSFKRGALLTPLEIEQRVDPLAPPTWRDVDERIDDYLGPPLSEWLRARYFGNNFQTKAEAERGLVILAAILKTNHADNWLADFLSQPPTPDTLRGVEALIDAVRADRVTDNYEEGRRASRRAAQAFREAGNFAGSARATLEEITALHFSESPRQCINEILQELPEARMRGYSDIEVQLQLEAYNCASLMSEVDRSRVSAAKALKLAVDHHFPGLAISAITFLAQAEYTEGKRKKASSSCADALTFYWSSRVSPSRVYGPYVVLDLLAQANELWHLDFAIGSEILLLFPPSRDPLMRAEEYTNLAHAAAMGGELDATSREITLAKQALDEAPHSVITENYSFDLKLFSAWLQGRSNPDNGIRSLDSLEEQLVGLQNDTLKAKYHLVRGELFAEQANLGEADRELSLVVYLRERQRSSIRHELDRASWTSGAAQPYVELADVKRREQDDAGSLAAMELYRGAAARDDTNLPLAQDSGVSNSLKPTLSSEASYMNQVLSQQTHATLVFYGLLPHGLGIWVATSQHGLDFRMVDVDPRNLLLLVKRFEELCASPNSSGDSIEAVASALYGLMIAPIAEKITRLGTIVIEPDPTFSLLPFQALIGPKGHYLADDYTVVLSAGLRYLPNSASQARGVTNDSRVLVVAGATDAELGLRPLDDVILEAENTAQHFAKSHMLIGNQTSLEEIKRQLPEVAVFHFVGHSAMTDGRMGLYLNTQADTHQKMIFTASDLRRGSLPGLKLAVLSACSTEPGSSQTILDPESMVRAMLRAGAADVVASRWDVDSAATHKLMSRFYDLLLSGETAPEALNHAEVFFRREFPNPYYWAAFAVFGRN